MTEVKKRVPWRLYWCSTEDHSDDWFVAAKKAPEAASFFEDQEAYPVGSVHAELVMIVPTHLHSVCRDAGDDGAGWPTHEFLRLCGFEFVRASSPRVCRLNDRTFAEGLLKTEMRHLLAHAIGNGTTPAAWVGGH